MASTRVSLFPKQKVTRNGKRARISFDTPREQEITEKEENVPLFDSIERNTSKGISARHEMIITEAHININASVRLGLLANLIT